MSARDAILARIRSASRGPRAEVEEIIRAHACGPQPRAYADLVQRFAERQAGHQHVVIVRQFAQHQMVELTTVLEVDDATEWQTLGFAEALVHRQ